MCYLCIVNDSPKEGKIFRHDFIHMGPATGLIRKTFNELVYKRLIKRQVGFVCIQALQIKGAAHN